ncbi:hypothetical protein [Sphingomonas daechungensis]
MTPVVGWAQATTGRPPAGAAVLGMTTIPDTGITVPSSAVVLYKTR